jgi:putative membrane protein
MIDPNRRAKTVAIIGAVVGLFVATAVIAYFNVGAVIAAIRPIGAIGFLAVLAAQVAIFVPLGLAWWLVIPTGAGSAPMFCWARLLREAASDVLPFSQLGGIVISARAAVLGGVSTPAAFAGCVVDITVEIAAQIIYTLFGVFLFIQHQGVGSHDHLLFALVAGLLIAAGVVASMVFTQRRGLNLVGQLARRIAPGAAEHATAINQVFDEAYARPARLLGSLALHVGAWFGGAAGTWLILRFIDHPLPFFSVVAIESLLFAIRNAAFMVPGGLGVQEGAYALIGPLFGLPAEAALALSLLKRARDVSIGVPALLSWQFVESRRRLRAK